MKRAVRRRGSRKRDASPDRLPLTAAPAGRARGGSNPVTQLRPSQQQEAVGEAPRPGEATPVQPSLTVLAARRHAVVGKTDHAIIVECWDFAYAAAEHRPAQWAAKYQSGYS